MKAAEPWETGLSPNEVLHHPQWPKAFPLGEQHLRRLDESPDTVFYSQPRLVQHIDDYAIAALQRHYRDVLPKGGAVLDLMSSWTSHLAPGAGSNKADGWFRYVSAVGMNSDELERNAALHDFHVQDLNVKPNLAMFSDETFDAVLCSVSVDYLSEPVELFAEMHRVLKPGGLAVFTWSNRMFPTKAISAWRQASEPARLWICGDPHAHTHPHSHPHSHSQPHSHTQPHPQVRTSTSHREADSARQSASTSAPILAAPIPSMRSAHAGSRWPASLENLPHHNNG